jgi:hypothetical protein
LLLHAWLQFLIKFTSFCMLVGVYACNCCQHLVAFIALRLDS